MTHELRYKLEYRQRLRMQCSFFIAFTVIVLAFTFYFASQRVDVQKKYFYPYPYRDIVIQYSEAYGVDSDLVAAVIRTESNFKVDVESERGALGLMQLMPDTANWIGLQLGEHTSQGSMMNSNIKDPEINIRFGTWYLSLLMREFRGNEVLALASYNAGIGNVRFWMQKYGWDYKFRDIKKIPFGETREYVRLVQKYKAKYRALYEH